MLLGNGLFDPLRKRKDSNPGLSDPQTITVESASQSPRRTGPRCLFTNTASEASMPCPDLHQLFQPSRDSAAYRDQDPSPGGRAALFRPKTSNPTLPQGTCFQNWLVSRPTSPICLAETSSWVQNLCSVSQEVPRTEDIRTEPIFRRRDGAAKSGALTKEDSKSVPEVFPLHVN